MNECNRSHKAPLSTWIYLIFSIASESAIRRGKSKRRCRFDFDFMLFTLVIARCAWPCATKKRRFPCAVCLFRCFAWQMMNGEFLHRALLVKTVSQQKINLSDWCRAECLRSFEALIIYHWQSLRMAARDDFTRLFVTNSLLGISRVIRNDSQLLQQLMIESIIKQASKTRQGPLKAMIDLMEMQMRWRKLQTNFADNSSDPVALHRRKDLSKTIREIFQQCTIKFFSAVVSLCNRTRLKLRERLVKHKSAAKRNLKMLNARQHNKRGKSRPNMDISDWIIITNHSRVIN